jgi:hypothetical protein
MARKTRRQKINTAQRRTSKSISSLSQDITSPKQISNKQDELDSWFNEQIPFIKKDLVKSILLSLIAITFEVILWRLI